MLAYIKNVTDKIGTEDLRRELLKYGELAYFDVSRPKVNYHVRAPFLPRCC